MIGANEGQWLNMALDICSNGTYHVFEIVPDTFRKLENGFKSYKNVTLNEFGLSNSNGKIELLHYPNSTTGSSMFDYSWGIKSEVIKCNIKTGLEYIESKNIDCINFLKIDTEGADYLVLLGFKNSLTKIEVIQFEYSAIALISRYFLKDFYDLLIDEGFLVGRIFPRYVDFKSYEIRTDENLVDGNFLAVRKNNSFLIEKLKNPYA